jgi:hypothetical protein
VQRKLFLVLALVAVACKSDPKTRAKESADAKDFWPEAPKPTVTKETRQFRYQPANIGAYRMVADGGVTTGPTDQRLAFKMIFDLDFRPGPTPTERNAHIAAMDLTMKAGPAEVVMRINNDEFYFKQGADETRVRRGEKSNIDVAALTEQPISIVTFDPTANTFRARPNPEHPLEQIGGAGDMLDSGLVLFPDLPTGAVAPGYQWSITRNTPIGSAKARTDIKYDFTYVGDGACPSGGASCSLLAFTASTPGVDVISDEGRKLHAVYGFAGKVFFNHERGAIDESRVRTVIDTEVNGMKMPIAATYRIAPRT